jgi:hypothetical protein
VALSERVKEPVERRPRGTPCSVGKLLTDLQGDELDAFRTMLGTPDERGWSAADIYDAVTAEGYTVAYQTINRHRGGHCSCPKGEQPDPVRLPNTGAKGKR